MFIDIEEREENDMLDYTYTIEEAKKEIKEKTTPPSRSVLFRSSLP